MFQFIITIIIKITINCYEDKIQSAVSVYLTLYATCCSVAISIFLYTNLAGSYS